MGKMSIVSNLLEVSKSMLFPDTIFKLLLTNIQETILEYILVYIISMMFSWVLYSFSKI